MAEQLLQAMQTMFAQMTTAQQSHTEALTELLKTVPKGGSADSGGLWRWLKAPALFDGKDSNWKEWSTKLRTYMITRESDGGKYLKWAETSADKVDNMAIIERFANESLDDERVLRFSNELHLQLQSCTSKEAFRLVISVEEGSVLNFVCPLSTTHSWDEENHSQSNLEQFTYEGFDACRLCAYAR